MHERPLAYIHAPQTHICVHRCTTYTYMHMCTTCIQLKVHICVSYTHTCTTKHTFVHGCTMYTYMHHMHHKNVCIDTQTCTICTHVHHMHHQLKVHICPSYTHTCITKHIYLHRCIYTYIQHMDHQKHT